MISINKAAELVGVSRRTIYNWLENGKLDYLRTAGGGVRIVEASLWRPAERDAAVAAPTTELAGSLA